jgi:uncharacterized membrane protein YbhN (UPF0104 family)
MLAIGAAALLLGVGVGVRVLRRQRNAFGSWADRLSLGSIGIATYVNGVTLASLMWIQDVLRLACATRAVGLSLSPTELAALSMLAMLGGLVPSVAGLGPVEGSLMAGLLSFGVQPASAVAVTAVERAISYGLSTVGGALVITIVGGRSLWRVIRAPSAGSTETLLASGAALREDLGRSDVRDS